MATITLTVPDSVATANIAAIRHVFPEDTDGKADGWVAKFGVRQGLKPFMRQYLVSLVDKAAFDAAMSAQVTAIALTNTESAAVKAAQQDARDQADADVDSIT